MPELPALDAATTLRYPPTPADIVTVRAQVSDIRSEIKDGALRLHITYDFAGARGIVAPP